MGNPPPQLVQFAARDGAQLTGRLRLPDPGVAPRGTAILCHPHPAFGGNMDVWLLPTVGAALAADGWAVLRFNFRSVATGLTDATDAHAAERADLAGAIAYVTQQQLGGERLALVGWSFGALIALLHGLEEPAVTEWVGIAPPTGVIPDLPMARVPSSRVAEWRAQRTVIVGAHEQFFPASTTPLVHAHQVHIVADADHFFFDLDHEVAALVVVALRTKTSPPSTVQR